MWNRPLIWYIFPICLFVILTALGATTVYTTRSIESFCMKHIVEDLQIRGRVMHAKVRLCLEKQDFAKLDHYCKKTGKEIHTRITVILPGGRVVGDTEKDPSSMDNHLKRPEIQSAIEKSSGHSVRYSNTLQKNMVYVASTIEEADKLMGVLRVSIPLVMIDEALHSFYSKVIGAGIVVAVFAAFFSLIIAQRMSKPLAEMKRGAERFAQGDFNKQLSIPLSQEMASLAQAMNLMARQLDDRIRTVINQRNQQEAILSSMVEGLLAVDNNKKIISLNQAATELIGLSAEAALGSDLNQVVQIDPLKDFISLVLQNAESSEKEFVISKENCQIFQAHGAVLRDAQGMNIGALVLFNDVTRLRRLEGVRRDFVANVSHELRTPITSIKGFVETMLDGALKNPDHAQRFLKIVARQAERLNAIVNDLLTLSRIEEEEQEVAIHLEEAVLEDILNTAVMLCRIKAAKKKIEIRVDCEAGLVAPMNIHLLEQAITNLIDNALKYSEEAAEVLVRASLHEEWVRIEVQDHGVGIPEEHLPRLFERFYRVDKARSRSLGGTGLGLAIVKHIVQAHQGSVSVESALGLGSTFSILIPR